MDEELQQKIQEALDQGISMKEIAGHLASHSNAGYQKYASSWLESASAPQTRASEYAPLTAGEKLTKIGSDVGTPILDFALENPKEAAAIAAGVYALHKAPKIIGAISERRLKSRQLDIEEMKARAFAEQVQKMGPKTDPQEIINLTKQANIGIPEEFIVQAPAQQTATQQSRSIEEAQRMAAQAKTAIQPPTQPNVPPTVQAPTDRHATGFFHDRVVDGVFGHLLQPPMGAGPPQQIAPTLTEAVATGQNATKAVQADVAAMVDKTPASEIVRTGTGRELIVGQGAEGGRFKTTYGAPQDVPAGYAFYPGGGVVDTLRQGLGQELFTKEFQVGNRPLPASIEEARNLIKDIKVAYNIPSREQLKAEGKPLPEQPKGIMRSKVTPTGESKGVIPVEVGGQKGTLMPKGKAQLGAGLPGMLSVLGLLGLSQTKDAKAAMEKASKAIKDIGISPDIMLRNPEEIGSLGRAYVTAGNPVYIRELSEQLATERDPDRRLMLTQEIIKAGGAVPPMR